MRARGRTAGDHGRAIRLAALGGAVGPILFVVFVALGGALYEGYSHVGQKISELGGEGAEYALIQNVNFIVLGASVIGFAWALARVLGPPYRGPVLIGIFGLSSSIANGLLPCDTGCQGETTVGMLHNVTGLIGFVAAITGMFVLARRWREDPKWSSHVRFTSGMAFVAVAGLTWFIASEASGTLGLSGLAQRVFAGALLLWILITAVRLFAEASRADPATPVSATSPKVASQGIHGG